MKSIYWVISEIWIKFIISNSLVYAAVPDGDGRWVKYRKKVNSPAVTLALLDEKVGVEILSVDIVPALEVPQGWPQEARVGLDVDKWLGKNVRRAIFGKPVYFVPKRPKAQKLSPDEKGPNYET